MRVNQRVLAMFFPLAFMISVLWVYFTSSDHPNSGLPYKFELEEKEGALSVINNSKYVKEATSLSFLSQAITTATSTRIRPVTAARFMMSC